MKTSIIICIALLITAGINLLFALEEADLILFNGKVITVDAKDNIFQAVAVKGDKILAVGKDVEIKAMAGSQ